MRACPPPKPSSVAVTHQKLPVIRVTGLELDCSTPTSLFSGVLPSKGQGRSLGDTIR